MTSKLIPTTSSSTSPPPAPKPTPLPGQISISGHEEPLIVGYARDINCTWNGATTPAKMEWLLVGFDGTPPTATATNSNTVILSPDPHNSGLDGDMFTCKVTLSDGTEFEETITLTVRALENIVSISSSSVGIPDAGDSVTLTCTATSERVPVVKWIDPNGETITTSSSTGMTVSPPDRYGSVTTVNLTFSSIRTSQSGTYKCVSNITSPPSKNETTHLIRIQIPPPTVTIIRDPAYPAQLFTSNRLTLTCVFELIPEVDSLVTVNSRWSGHSSLTDSQRRVIISELEGRQLRYESSVSFSTLKTSDSGSYVCSANIVPEEDHLLASTWASESLNLTVYWNVSISVSYNPPSDFLPQSPPYYRPATSVSLTCNAHGATGSISYYWTSTCSSCFASGTYSQTISKEILTSNDAGIHTCTATDSTGTSISASTEMKLYGIGIYVQNSEYHDYLAVGNNSVIVADSGSCEGCDIDVYCYSNSTSSYVGYVVFPNGGRIYSTYDYYDLRVERLSPSGIHFEDIYNYYLDLFGIYTCELPDSEGNTLEASIGVYDYTPSSPFIDSISYTDQLDRGDSVLGVIEFSTRYSPPTTVTWLIDGAPVTVDGYNYEMLYNVTDRSSTYYDNTLIIRSAVDLIGYHTYTCTVSNYAGSTSVTVDTDFTGVYPVVSILPTDEPILESPFEMTCVASLHPKVASQLVRYLMLVWVGPDGETLDSRNDDNNIVVGNQQTFYDTVARSLNIKSVNVNDSGNYSCEARLQLPNSGQTFTATTLYSVVARNRALVQLQLGPMVHCTKWFEDLGISTHLEENIKSTLTDVINTQCNCGFRISQIDRGEFSCQTSTASVTYRARIADGSDTVLLPEVLSSIQDWITSDGTFLYTYYGSIRLRVDPSCPLVITSFSDPECSSGLLLESRAVDEL